MEREKRALPFETERGFTSIPNAVCMYYVRHPKFTPAVERLYRYLLSRYNDNHKYAFPSWNAIIRETGLGRGTVSSGLKALEHLGLINRIDHENDSDFNNKIYTFNRPIEDEEEFYRRFGHEIPEKSPKAKVSTVIIQSKLDVDPDWF